MSKTPGDSNTTAPTAGNDKRRRPSIRDLEPEVRSDAGPALTGLAELAYLKVAHRDGLIAPYVVIWQFNAKPGMADAVVNWLEQHEYKLFGGEGFTPPKGYRYCGCLRATFGAREAWAGEFRIIWHVDSWDDIENFKNPQNDKTRQYVDLAGMLEGVIDVVSTQIYQPAVKT